MSQRTYIYIDGESHFIRSEQCWKAKYGMDARLTEVGFPPPFKSGGCVIEPNARVFWDKNVLWQQPQRDFVEGTMVLRATYFTAMTGDPDALHETQTRVRAADLEPVIVHELKQLFTQRENTLLNSNVIEKAKGVDIALAVRALEDAHRNNFDKCLLFTSDVDFLPLIEAIRRMGKNVAVFGYRSGMSRHSPLEVVPDKFYDLTNHVQKVCTLNPAPSRVK